MRRNERLDDNLVAMAAAFNGFQASLWTAMPGIVVAFDPAAMTAQVQPAIQARLVDRAGAATWVTLPVLVDCPVVFPAGGGFTLTFPIAVGDECLVIFASRCIDAWWQLGGVQVQAELRLHDLSDGFVIPGGRSQPHVIPSLSTTDVVLRSDDGTAKVSIKANKDIDLTTTANITMSATEVNIVGVVNITGNVATTGTLTNNGHSVGSNHVHGGVSTGAGNTGVPT